jgi:hypothetical protein
MTRKKLIRALSKRLGVRLVDDPRPIGREVKAYSRNGTVLFTITVFEPAPGHWAFGGCGSLLEGLWGEMCRIGDPPMPDVEKRDG